VRKYSVRPSRCQLFQGVLVVQTSENRLGSHAAIIRNLVAARGRLWNWRERYWNTWPRTLVWTAVIVMRDPLQKRAFQVVLRKRDQEVQALSPGRAHHPLAIRISLRGAHRRPKHPSAHGFCCLVQIFGVDPIAVMDHEAVRVVPRQGLSELP